MEFFFWGQSIYLFTCLYNNKSSIDHLLNKQHKQTSSVSAGVLTISLIKPVGCSGHPLALRVHYMLLEDTWSGREAERDRRTSVQQPTGICPGIHEVQ